jgi:hypothetical protein
VGFWGDGSEFEIFFCGQDMGSVVDDGFGTELKGIGRRIVSH